MRSPLPQPAPVAARDAGCPPSPRRARSAGGTSRRRRPCSASVAPSKSSSAVRAMAPRTPPASRYPSRVRVRPSRRAHVSMSACESSGRAPGSPAASPKDELDQAGLAPKPFRLRRLLDGSLHLALGHRAEQARCSRTRGWRALRAPCSGRRSPLAARRASFHVGPRAHRRTARARLVGAEGEGLLQLIDDEKISVRHPRFASVQRHERIRPRREQGRARHPGEVASPRGRDDTRPGPETTSRTRKPRRWRRTDCRASRARTSSEDFVATEEQIRVVRLELQEAAIRALGRRRHRLQTPVSTARTRSPGDRSPAIGEAPGRRGSNPSGRRVADEPGSGLREEHLPPSARARMRAARFAVGPRRPPPPSASPVCNPTRTRIRMPSGHGSAVIAPTRSDAARAASAAPVKTETVESPSPIDSSSRPPCPSITSGDDGVVANEDAAHRVRMGLPETGRALDVGHAQRDDARREIGFPAGAKTLDQLPGRRGTSGRIGCGAEPDRLFEHTSPLGVETGRPLGGSSSRRASREERERGHGQGEDVRGAGGRFACRHLGRDEARGPRPDDPVAGRGDPEVHDDDSAVLGEDEVGGLDVAVDDGRVVPVQEGERFGCLGEGAEDGRGRAARVCPVPPSRRPRSVPSIQSITMTYSSS